MQTRVKTFINKCRVPRLEKKKEQKQRKYFSMLDNSVTVIPVFTALIHITIRGIFFEKQCLKRIVNIIAWQSKISTEHTSGAVHLTGIAR